MTQKLLPIDHLALPQVQSAFGWDDLSKQSDRTERHIPVTPEVIDEYRFVLICLDRKAVIYPDEVPTWEAIISRCKSYENGNPEFLTTQEQELLNCFVNYREEFAESWRQIYGQKLIGHTGLIWRWMENLKEYHPAIRDTRFRNDSLLTLSWHYIESCLAPERQPQHLDEDGWRERIAILSAAKTIRCNESLEGISGSKEAIRFLRSLWERYPPPFTEGREQIDNGKPSRSRRLMP